MSLHLSDTIRRWLPANRFWMIVVMTFGLSLVAMVGYQLPVRSHSNVEPLVQLGEGNEAAHAADDRCR